MEGQEHLRWGLTQPRRRPEDAPWGQRDSHQEEPSAWVRGQALAHTQGWPPWLAGAAFSPVQGQPGLGPGSMVTSSGVTPCSQGPKCNERPSPGQGRWGYRDGGGGLTLGLTHQPCPPLPSQAWSPGTCLVGCIAGPEGDSSTFTLTAGWGAGG